MRIARRLKQFRLSLVATLAMLALTACGPQRESVAAASSLATGVQQMLRAAEATSPPAVPRDLRIAATQPTRNAP